MFARHTPTRMKGSGVVQSLKSWASRLHPQLPLNQKESQRLLTALTSSFRQQLDKAHPSRVSGENSNSANATAAGPKAGIRDVHVSSVVSADRHLASVLTNPLLATSPRTAEPALNYSSVEKSLDQDPSQDTIALLEEYCKHGAATVPIAALCLERFKLQIAQLSASERMKTVLEKQAGRRTMAWLLKSGLHDTDDFVDNGRLRGAMVPLLCEEGHEDLLWEWLAMDLGLGTQHHPKGYAGNHVKQTLHANRWRAVLIRDIVQTKLSASQNQCADAALDALSRAFDLYKHGATFSLQPPKQSIAKAFTRTPYIWRNTDPAKYDQMLDIVALSSPDTASSFEWSSLRLCHPRNPAALPMLNILRSVFDADASAEAPEWAQRLRIRMKDPKGKPEKGRIYFHRVFLRTAALLQRDSLTRDADWVLSLTKRLYPTLDHDVEWCLKRDSDYFAAISKQSHETKHKGPPAVAPFLAFV